MSCRVVVPPHPLRTQAADFPTTLTLRTWSEGGRETGDGAERQPSKKSLEQDRRKGVRAGRSVVCGSCVGPSGRLGMSCRAATRLATERRFARSSSVRGGVTWDHTQETVCPVPTEVQRVCHQIRGFVRRKGVIASALSAAVALLLLSLAVLLSPAACGGLRGRGLLRRWLWCGLAQ